MALLITILEIISAIPSVIAVIKEIIAFIHGLKGADQRDAQSQLHAILKKHLRSGDAVACKADLEQLHSDLQGKYGALS